MEKNLQNEQWNLNFVKYVSEKNLILAYFTQC